MRKRLESLWLALRFSPDQTPKAHARIAKILNLRGILKI